GGSRVSWDRRQRTGFGWVEYSSGISPGRADNRYESDDLGCRTGLRLHRRGAASGGSVVSALHAGGLSRRLEVEPISVPGVPDSFCCVRRVAHVWLFV